MGWCGPPKRQWWRGPYGPGKLGHSCVSDVACFVDCRFLSHNGCHHLLLEVLNNYPLTLPTPFNGLKGPMDHGDEPLRPVHAQGVQPFGLRRRVSLETHGCRPNEPALEPVSFSHEAVDKNTLHSEGSFTSLKKVLVWRFQRAWYRCFQADRETTG